MVQVTWKPLLPSYGTCSLACFIFVGAHDADGMTAMTATRVTCEPACSSVARRKRSSTSLRATVLATLRIAMPSVTIFLAASLIIVAATVSADDQPPIRCAAFANRSVPRSLPASAINDGYCDCPHDGQDEPDTGACAGSVDGGWAGVPAADSGHEA